MGTPHAVGGLSEAGRVVASYILILSGKTVKRLSVRGILQLMMSE